MVRLFFFWKVYLACFLLFSFKIKMVMTMFMIQMLDRPLRRIFFSLYTSKNILEQDPLLSICRIGYL